MDGAIPHLDSSNLCSMYIVLIRSLWFQPRGKYVCHVRSLSSMWLFWFLVISCNITVNMSKWHSMTNGTRLTRYCLVIHGSIFRVSLAVAHPKPGLLCVWTSPSLGPKSLVKSGGQPVRESRHPRHSHSPVPLVALSPAQQESYLCHYVIMSYPEIPRPLWKKLQSFWASLVFSSEVSLTSVFVSNRLKPTEVSLG